jgi:hypothetical protein
VVSRETEPLIAVHICNLYSVTKSQDAVRHHLRLRRDHIGQVLSTPNPAGPLRWPPPTRGHSRRSGTDAVTVFHQHSNQHHLDQRRDASLAI